jgi:hypothetical protein
LLMLKFKDREHLNCPPKCRPKSANDFILAERVGNSDDQWFHVMFAQSVPRIGIDLLTGGISTSSGIDYRTILSRFPPWAGLDIHVRSFSWHDDQSPFVYDALHMSVMGVCSMPFIWIMMASEGCRDLAAYSRVSRSSPPTITGLAPRRQATVRLFRALPACAGCPADLGPSNAQLHLVS